MSNEKESNEINKKMLKSWSGEIAYIIEDDKKSSNQESPIPEEIPDETVNETTIKLDEDRMNSIRLLKAIKDSLAVHKALCEHNEIPNQKVLYQDTIKASIGTETLKKVEKPKIKPGQSSKDTNNKKPTNYLKLWNEKHKLDALKSKDERFPRISNKLTLCETDTRANQIKSGRKISYYVQDNVKRGRIGQLEKRDKYASQHKPEISPERFSPQRLKKDLYLNRPGTKQNASVNANFKRELIEFKSGTSDFLKNSSANTTKNVLVDITTEQKAIGRQITSFLDGARSEFQSDHPDDFMGILPLIKPKSFPFYSENSPANQGVNVTFKDFRSMETIREKDREGTPNDSYIINSDQKSIRKSLINGHDFSQEGSNFILKNKKKFGSQLSYKMTNAIPFTQREEYVYVSRPAKSRSAKGVVKFPTPNCEGSKECKCQEQTLPMTAQNVDMTPFLVQLLESCLKVPATLRSIRNVNNTFVSDLRQWKSFSRNVVGQSDIPDKKLNTSSHSAPKTTEDNTSCQTCGDCHHILEKIMGILNEKTTKPCMDTNHPGGILCKACGCGKSQEKLKLPGFTACECGGNANKPGSKKPRKGKEILTYHAKCSVPYQISPNPFNTERKTLIQPRCAAADFDSDSDDNLCSHCSSCSSCSNC